MSTYRVITILTFALVSLIVVQAEAKPREAYKLLVKRQICSKNLADSLKDLCKDFGYNGPDWGSQEMDPSNPGAMMMDGLYQMPVGIVDECCHRVCSRETLKSYCRIL